MEQAQNNPTGECNSFKRKLGNTTYNVTVHFNENSTETFLSAVIILYRNLALMYVACSLTIVYFEQISLIAVLLWIGISYIFYWKKMNGKL